MKPEPDDPAEEEDCAHQQREQRGEGRVAGRVAVGQRGNRDGGQRGQGAFGADDHLAGGGEQRVAEQRQHRRVETDDDRQARDLGVAETGRDRDGCDRHGRDRVGAEPGPAPLPELVHARDGSACRARQHAAPECCEPAADLLPAHSPILPAESVESRAPRGARDPPWL